MCSLTSVATVLFCSFSRMFQSCFGSYFSTLRRPPPIPVLIISLSLSFSLSIPQHHYFAPVSQSLFPEPSTAGPLGQAVQPQAASYSWRPLGGKPRPRRSSKGGTEGKKRNMKSGGEQCLPIYCAAEEREIMWHFYIQYHWKYIAQYL